MKVGWLADNSAYVGGAEMTQAEFRAATPEGIEVVDCPKDGVVPGLDRYVLHNVGTYTAGDIDRIDAPMVKYLHDVWPHSLDPRVRDTVLAEAKLIFCSPLQRDHMGLDGECIPPALPIDTFKPPRQHKRNGKREGTCSIAQWRNPDKGPFRIDEWAAQNGIVHAYGPGDFHPRGAAVEYRGDLEGPGVREAMWTHERFVFLPNAIEPFCRTLVEAYFAGCEIVTNLLIGARHYLEDDPEALRTAADDFWQAVTS